MEWISPIFNQPVIPPERLNQGIEKGALGLEKACRDFETYFTASLFSEMTKTLEMNEKHGASGQQEQWMWSLVGQTVAEELSKGAGLGLGKALAGTALNTLGITQDGLR